MSVGVRHGLIALMLFSLIPGSWAQDGGTAQTERLDGTVKGVVIGLRRVTLAILSSRQIMTYLHTSQEKLPPWLRTGMEVTVRYRREGDGSLWIEQISPYTPPEPTPTIIAPASAQAPVANFQTFFSTLQTPSFVQPPVQSRHESIESLRKRQLPSRGLTSALRERIPNFDPIESEVMRLLPHYKAAAKFFNPNLTDQQAETIAAAILRSSIRNGVDPRLVVAVVACESSFRPDAVGKKGEIGLGQLKPETATALGVDPYDPVQNVDGCVRYLKRQLNSFGSLELALAAYNAGPNAVRKAGGIPQNGITPKYVQKVLDLYRRLCGQ